MKRGAQAKNGNGGVAIIRNVAIDVDIADIPRARGARGACPRVVRESGKARTRRLTPF